MAARALGYGEANLSGDRWTGQGLTLVPTSTSSLLRLRCSLVQTHSRASLDLCVCDYRVVREGMWPLRPGITQSVNAQRHPTKREEGVYLWIWKSSA